LKKIARFSHPAVESEGFRLRQCACCPFLAFHSGSVVLSNAEDIAFNALGWRAMRWVPALHICVAASLLIGNAAYAANDVSIRIGDWILRPHFAEQKKQKEKRLDRCTAQLTNADKITMIYTLDTHYMWTLELSNPSWNFPSGSKFDVSF